MKKARILIPDWMREQTLLRIYKSENENISFQELPFYAFEIAKLLFLNASDDFKLCHIDINRTRVLLKDIESKRNSKIVNGLKEIEANTIYLSLPNVSSLELNKLRHFVPMRLKFGSQITDIQNKQNQSGHFSANQDEDDQIGKVEESDYEQSDDDDDVSHDNQSHNENQPLRKLRRLQK